MATTFASAAWQPILRNRLEMDVSLVSRPA
jgi:hypothetical protein